ncbi:chorismate synthase, partial [Clostridium beijerinckii]
AEKKEAELVIEGRHDPCIAQRAVPVIEAVTAIGILDLVL